MIKPSNGEGYDSFIYGQYFNLVVDGATAADQITLNAIAAINSLPDNITLADKDLVVAAREAYDKIASFAQRALVTNLDKLLKAEQRISDLEYIRDEQNQPEGGENEGEGNTDTEAQLPENWEIVVLGAAIVLIGLVAVAAVIVAVIFFVLFIIARKKLAGNVEKKAKKAKKTKKASEISDSVEDGGENNR